MASDTGALQLGIEKVRERHVSDLVLLENMLFHGEDDLRKVLADPCLHCLVATGCCPRPWVPEPRDIADVPWEIPSTLVSRERRVLGALFGYAVRRNIGVVKEEELRKDFCNIANIPTDIDAPFDLVASALLDVLKKRARRERWSHLEVNIDKLHIGLMPFFEKHGFAHVPTKNQYVRRLVWSLLSGA